MGTHRKPQWVYTDQISTSDSRKIQPKTACFYSSVAYGPWGNAGAFKPISLKKTLKQIKGIEERLDEEV